MKASVYISRQILNSTGALNIVFALTAILLLNAFAHVVHAECISWIANQISVGAFAIERWQILGLAAFYPTMVAAAYAEKRVSNRLTRTVRLRLRERVGQRPAQRGTRLAHGSR